MKLLNAPVLKHFDPILETRVETDSSDTVIAGALSQRHNELWHPVAFFSETMIPAEMNYSIHDKELLAVVRALQCWRPELIGLEKPFTVITDHRELEHFSTKRLLNSRQATWAEVMSQYHFEITYRPGTENGAADDLSRKTGDLRTQKAKQEAARTMRLFRPALEPERRISGIFEIDDALRTMHIDNVPEITLADEVPETTDVLETTLADDVPKTTLSGFMLLDELLRANRDDPSLQEFRQKVLEGHNDWTSPDGRMILYKGRLAVPLGILRTRAIDEIHSSIARAHPGQTKTRRLVAEQFWWPGLAGDVDRFVHNCLKCRRAKVPRDKTPGLLQPLPIPSRRWRNLALDFKKMPEDRHGYNNCLVIIDRLSKASWITPCQDSATAKDAAKMYYEGPFRIFGLPQTITSDRGPQFISAFTDELCKILGIKWRLASAGHSQTTGQAEIMNEYLDQRLRPFINHYQDNWSEAIPAMDAAQMGLPHESTGCQPHEVLMGFPMPVGFDWRDQTDTSNLTVRERITREEAQKTARTIQEYWDHARQIILQAQERMQQQANRRRRVPDFGPGDFVYY